ncbi:3-phenylpropionate/trans-cinnamate dioxygenase ferredoxin reductase subunit [Panacagrimonas perspica]|uniref:3-phenylpropionate/trans-cinnamate dioxygenase ferredoxin reductase subunit n=1 Tax=Panacagrimonas perspica TaxID=381431 RepID=A0A4R7P724_9GAMM|nr:FAD-dependent oxidoreductase [Panacagrimonas perspica]TDU28880.1 3-phenylpropionate/trans-cinnamate dioxygenase ferredoxin reductase subunit [Panacagrimonas perspica]THD02293.1 hypothetical protein B1810_15305 [Panacagrimonas perspica]
MSKKTFVIVGAGQAGGQAVQTLLSEGFDGRIVVVGDERHVPYERPALSKEVLLHGEPQSASALMLPAAFYEDKGVELRLSCRASAIDREHKRVVLGGGGIGYDKLLLATGSRPRALNIPGADLDGVRFLRTIDDSVALHRCMKEGARVVIVGGGFIGLEAAAAARSMGCEVTVLEMHPNLLQRIAAPHLGRLYEDLHRANGVEIRVSSVAIGMLGNSRVEHVICSDGTMIPADVVLVGVGVVPNVELARDAGLNVEDGIVVDEFGRTSDPDIFAAGDVACHTNEYVGRRVRLESWENARNQSIGAAKAMCGRGTPYCDVPWFWSDQFDVNMQMLGLPDRWDDAVVRGDRSEMKFTVFYLRQGQIVGASMVNRGGDVTPTRKMMRERRIVDPKLLTDQAHPLRRMAASA